MLYLWSWANPGADIEYWCNYILIPHSTLAHTGHHTHLGFSIHKTQYLWKVH